MRVMVGENVGGEEFFDVGLAGDFPKPALVDLSDFISEDGAEFGGFAGAGAVFEIADEEVVGGLVFEEGNTRLRRGVEYGQDAFFIKIEKFAGGDEFIGKRFLIEIGSVRDFVVGPFAERHIKAVLAEGVFQSLSFVVGDFESHIELDGLGHM